MKKSVIKNQFIVLTNIHNFCLPQTNTLGPYLGHHVLELHNTVQLLFSDSAIWIQFCFKKSFSFQLLQNMFTETQSIITYSPKITGVARNSAFALSTQQILFAFR